MAVRSRFTRIPKVHDLILAGVPTEVIPTYCALADYSNNKTGLCWPRMETLARRLSRSPRTIQRHLHLLKEKGLIEFVKRKRDWHGRFGAYLYRVVHIAAATSRKAAQEVADRKGWRRKNRPTTGHGGHVAPNNGLTKQEEDTPYPPKRIQRTVTGPSSEKGLQKAFKNSTKNRLKRAEKRRLAGVGEDSSGFLSSD